MLYFKVKYKINLSKLNFKELFTLKNYSVN